jgi:DNA-directed RNA polymerase specialized sigma24 family protein
MSAAVQAPLIWEARRQQVAWRESRQSSQAKPLPRAEKQQKTEEKAEPAVSLAFYRKHTESMLRRYLYASMQVGRSPSILGDPVARGWVSSRPVKTFEDAVIFVLDIERCIDRLGSLERELLSRIVLQEYTQVEAAQMLGMSPRTITSKFAQALDRLTEMLLETGLLVLPQ